MSAYWFSILVFLLALLHGFQAGHLVDIVAESRRDEIKKKFFSFSLKTSCLHVAHFLLAALFFFFIKFLFPSFRLFSVNSFFFLLFGGYAFFLFFFQPEEIHQHDHGHQHVHSSDPGGIHRDNHSHKSHEEKALHEHEHQHLHSHMEGRKKKHAHIHKKSILNKVLRTKNFLFFVAVGAFMGIFPFSLWIICSALMLLGLMISVYLSGVFYRIGGIRLIEKCTNVSNLLSGCLAIFVSFKMFF